MTKFLLFGIVLFFGLLLVYTFKVIAISGLIYLSSIPISYLHYKKIKKQNFINVSYRNLSGGIVAIHSAWKV